MRAPAAISPRALIGLSAVLVATLAAGVLFLGFGGRAPAAVAAGGCTERPFAYDAAELARQNKFERGILGGGATLPAVGFHAERLDPVASLHAASHSYIVVYYRPGTPTAALKALADDAVAEKAPVLVSPRAQKPAVVAITQNRELSCSGTGGVREFAARYYASLAS
jgi:hypothetical protein